MELKLTCPNERCRAAHVLRMDDPGQPSAATCSTCGADLLPRGVGRWRSGERVDACPRCGGDEFFVRRDFPQRFGLAVVVAAAIASFALLRISLAWALGVLAAVVLIDAALYVLTGSVTVCYRCRAEFRGVAYNPRHAGFDLATAEKYQGA